MHPDEGVEDHSVKLEEVSIALQLCPCWIVVAENLVASKVKNECDDQLEDCLANNHFPHVRCDERCFLTRGLAVKNFRSGRTTGVSDMSNDSTV